MTTETGDNTRIRDYSKEYEKRKKRNKRLLVDMDREKALLFLEHLNNQGTTFSAWLKNEIDKELKIGPFKE